MPRKTIVTVPGLSRPTGAMSTAVVRVDVYVKDMGALAALPD